MKYFLIAGEASGDLHASQLMMALLKKDPSAEFRYFGGEKMNRVGGELVKHYKKTAFMGFLSVLANLDKVLANFRLCKIEIIRQQPDALILVDYPSFNLKVAKFVKKQLPECKIFYFIPPKLWAWKEYRIQSIKKYVDKVFSILPFEVDFYKKHNYEVDYVGNPSLEEVELFKYKFDRITFLNDNRMLEKPIIGLLPGSRMAEIRSNLPIMLSACASMENCQIIIAGAPNVDEFVYEDFVNKANLFNKVPVLYNQSFEILSVSSVALVVSGTATLEAALLGTPQIVCYKKSGNEFVKQLYFKMLKVKFVSLVNLIAGHSVVTELLVNDMNIERVKNELTNLFQSDKARSEMMSEYRKIRVKLTSSICSDEAAIRILSLLSS